MRIRGRNVVTLATVLLLVLITACAPAPGEITPAPAPTPEPTPAPTPVGFFLKVTEPKDESTVTSSAIPVSGTTSPDAVVSVNSEMVEVDERGNFSTMVTLEEGPNIIEVIASDFEGNKEGSVLAVIYIP
ncbi:unnamed protein product [marine sediment metagenome]|uniref:Bacterial Ig domain-containing protein n=1 Tax=marine sediment metagenome TaxID=412755 RepID=X1MVP8_9ZZZZ